MNYDTALVPSVTDLTDAGPGQGRSAFDPLQLIVDPAGALEAARRMEATCRSGFSATSAAFGHSMSSMQSNLTATPS